jgi:hypothetical protein
VQRHKNTIHFEHSLDFFIAGSRIYRQFMASVPGDYQTAIGNGRVRPPGDTFTVQIHEERANIIVSGASSAMVQSREGA